MPHTSYAVHCLGLSHTHTRIECLGKPQSAFLFLKKSKLFFFCFIFINKIFDFLFWQFDICSTFNFNYLFDQPLSTLLLFSVLKLKRHLYFLSLSLFSLKTIYFLCHARWHCFIYLCNINCFFLLWSCLKCLLFFSLWCATFRILW